MGKQVNIITKLHKKTTRDYISRMMDEKVHCMDVAKRYDHEYWDGDRRYGYGGYKYDGRWQAVAQDFIDMYGLTNESKVLDVGCGKAFIIHEIKQLLPGCEIAGFDISQHGIDDARPEIKEFLFIHDAADKFPFGDKYFDLVISSTALHNLRIYNLKTALSEIERVGKQGYVMVEAYRNSLELFNLECWALTCETFMRPDEWIWMYDEFGYTGDYEFIYFE
jgi:ubiquinone/menaquinone biosynthesis C-methylase UbiE